MMKQEKEFEVFCPKEGCKSRKLFGTEGKTYHVEESPQKMIFFNKLKICMWFNNGETPGTHYQHYCPSCFSVKTIVINAKGKLVYMYEDEIKEIEEDYEDD